jgi:hypothetical protein
VPVREIQGWTSPRLKVRFEIIDSDLNIFRPDGQKFLSFLETEAKIGQERRRAESEKQRADMLEAKLKALNEKLSNSGLR